MVVTFNDVVILDKFEGVSKAGKPYGRLRMLVDGCEVFEIFISEKYLDSCAGLERKSRVNKISFDLRPGYNGGVRLVPAW